jgi:hypothetical protein
MGWAPGRKAHTREGDAIAAARRRLPMVEVDATIPLTGPHGPVTLLEVFEGRRQLIAYYFMWQAGQPAEAQCGGCTFAVPQGQHGPLPPGESGQRLPDLRPERLAVRDFLVSKALRQDRRRGFPPPAGAPPGPVRVHHDAPQVGVQVRSPRVGVEPRPRPVELDQAGLDQILRRGQSPVGRTAARR